MTNEQNEAYPGKVPSAEEQLATSGIISEVPGFTGSGAHEGGEVVAYNLDVAAIAQERIRIGADMARIASMHEMMAIASEQSARSVSGSTNG